jgi:4-amino-4-deoxy-L-arabinose transferase-like glycosyltransferase
MQHSLKLQLFLLLKNSSMPKVPFWVFILLAVLYFSAIRVDTMDVDASQYAEMSREMMKSGDYLHVYDRGHDYLDKPPFLFWVSSVSMKVFGANNLGFKLPSILFALLALYATYRLTRRLYDENTARMAALILGTCQGFFLMTNDVRCDTILMSWVITAIWLLKEWDISGKLYWLLLGAAAVAFGMMTKGPIALMVPVFCFASDWILKRQWKKLFKPQYILAIIVIGILLIPMSIGLYQQFDLHPEKLIDGKYNTSGLRFFFWSQSFGRITGESPWQNSVDMSFLLSNMLWSYLPWILLFLVGLVINVIELFKQKLRLSPQQEWISTGGFILTYLALGSSRYQLPHYIFVAFPLASIVVAKLLKDFFEGRYRRVFGVMKPVQTVIAALLFVGALLTITYVFKAGALAIAIWAVSVLVWLYIAFKKQLAGKMLYISAAGILLVNIILTNFFYYNLLKYEVGATAGRFIKAQNINTDKVFAYRMKDPINALPFYANGVIQKSDTPLTVLPKVDYVLTMDSGITDLQLKGYRYDIAYQGKLFKVSELTPDFLNPNTRDKATSNYYLLKLK